MTLFADSSINDTVRHPLRLAALYKTCLGTQWKTQAEASRVLSKMNVDVTENTIQLAVKVSDFPDVILGLFDATGLNNWNAKGLVKARAEHGLEVLVQRARFIDPSGRTAAQIINLLRGEQPSRTATPRMTPLHLAARYREGLESGEWESTRKAAEALGLTQRKIAEALAIARLPAEVKACFTPRTLTRQVGMELLELSRIRGADALRKAALEARAMVPRLTRKAFMARLAGVHATGVELKVKRAARRLVIEFHCDADADKLDLKMHWLALWAQRAIAEVR